MDEINKKSTAYYLSNRLNLAGTFKKLGEPVESTGTTVGDKSDFQGISLAEKTPLNTDLNVHRVNLEAITSGVMKNKDNLDIKNAFTRYFIATGKPLQN